MGTRGMDGKVETPGKFQQRKVEKQGKYRERGQKITRTWTGKSVYDWGGRGRRRGFVKFVREEKASFDGVGSWALLVSTGEARAWSTHESKRRVGSEIKEAKYSRNEFIQTWINTSRPITLRLFQINRCAIYLKWKSLTRKYEFQVTRLSRWNQRNRIYFSRYIVEADADKWKHNWSL